jgi:hypothetical protein
MYLSENNSSRFFRLNTIENCLCRDVIVTQNVDYGTSNVSGDACRQETTQPLTP